MSNNNIKSSPAYSHRVQRSKRGNFCLICGNGFCNVLTGRLVGYGEGVAHANCIKGVK